MAPGVQGLKAQPSLRWYGAVGVFVLHVLVVLALLRTDHLRPKPLVAPTMLLIPTAEPRSEQLPQPLPILPRSVTPAPITLPPPSFSIRTEREPPMFAAPPRPGLDLSIKKEARPTIEQLFPSPAERQKKAMDEINRDNDIANEKDPPIIDSDCVAVVPNHDPTPTAGAFGVGSIPVLVCSPHQSLKALKKRNDLYSPH